MDIHIFDQQFDLKISHSSVEDIVQEVLSLEEQSCDEVSIHFVDTPTICKLHKQYFNDSSTTDCISFPIDSPEEGGYCLLGEVFVCPKTAIEYAKKHNTDPHQETTLYLVHGILHLLGYDDQYEAEPEMRAAEERQMKNLSKRNLVLGTNI
ncbi:MAG: Endoribonuclease YbeY [Chlamydiae bacterium]|nr:Endoribonuclease YbeY [Chlamydiota bacterium]